MPKRALLSSLSTSLDELVSTRLTAAAKPIDPIDIIIGFISPVTILWLIGLLAGAFIFVHLILPLLSGERMRRKPGLYKSRQILTRNETEFYNRMVSALPEYVVHTQIAMSALIEPRVDRMKDGSEYMRLRAKFSQKYVDFVVCRPGKLEVIAIVELDDITHDLAKDALRDEMLEGAFYNVVRWHSRSKPDRNEIWKTIKKLDRQLATKT